MIHIQIKRSNIIQWSYRTLFPQDIQQLCDARLFWRREKIQPGSATGLKPARRGDREGTRIRNGFKLKS